MAKREQLTTVAAEGQIAAKHSAREKFQKERLLCAILDELEQYSGLLV